MCLHIAEGLDWMTFGGPFQPKLFYDFVLWKSVLNAVLVKKKRNGSKSVVAFWCLAKDTICHVAFL